MKRIEHRVLGYIGKHPGITNDKLSAHFGSVYEYTLEMLYNDDLVECVREYPPDTGGVIVIGGIDTGDNWSITPKGAYELADHRIACLLLYIFFVNFQYILTIKYIRCIIILIEPTTHKAFALRTTVGLFWIKMYYHEQYIL